MAAFYYRLCQVMSDKSLFIERQNFILCHNFSKICDTFVRSDVQNVL